VRVSARATADANVTKDIAAIAAVRWDGGPRRDDAMSPASQALRRQVRVRPTELGRSTVAHPHLPIEPASDLLPLDELRVAMAMIAQIDQTIENADTKTGMLGALLGLLLAAIAGDPSLVHATLDGSTHPPYVATALLIAFAISLVTSGVFLGLAQLPRLTGTKSRSWLAFPAVPPVTKEAIERPSAVELRDQAWHQVQVLAAIARRKFRYVKVAFVACGSCTFAYLAWLAIAAHSVV
jgi:hypothetical protein